MKEFDFANLEPIEIPVKRRDGKQYVLCECSELGAAAWRNARTQGVQMEQDTDAETQKFLNLPENLGGIQALLLSYCLHHTDQTGQKTGQLVARQTIEGWLSREVSPMYDTALEISELLEEDDTEESLLTQIGKLQKRLKKIREGAAKNEPSDTGDGSG